MKETKYATIDEEIDSIANRIITEVETASSKDISEAEYARKILQLSDLHYTTKLLREIESASSGSGATIEKRAVIKALLLSTWMQRLYFIIRTFIMSFFGTAITAVYIWYFGDIGIYSGLFVGALVFFLTLIVTRFFDPQIVTATKMIIRRLSKYPAIRDFIMNHF
ncbi:MAG: hypothetical protein A3K76_00120 [Euryarchaeota archaeon RBG_13_57_23]|nr:MAG: hypothetical protein A3K76_00120 [Euryarchaeota archaeon RBG_13_57_23]